MAKQPAFLAEDRWEVKTTNRGGWHWVATSWIGSDQETDECYRAVVALQDRGLDVVAVAFGGDTNNLLEVGSVVVGDDVDGAIVQAKRLAFHGARRYRAEARRTDRQQLSEALIDDGGWTSRRNGVEVFVPLSSSRRRQIEARYR